MDGGIDRGMWTGGCMDSGLRIGVWAEGCGQGVDWGGCGSRCDRVCGQGCRRACVDRSVWTGGCGQRGCGQKEVCTRGVNRWCGQGEMWTGGVDHGCGQGGSWMECDMVVWTGEWWTEGVDKGVDREVWTRGWTWGL